ncbi:hypothetical protein JYT76_03260 [Olleya sp. AH-315-F22]|nr:hypothetical protein [Olleya sp. AH-315-F22]
MKQFTVLMHKGSQTPMKVVVTAQNQHDAKRQAESMHRGWRANSVR